MGIKKFKPVTSASRYKSVLDFKEITETEPYKPLTLTLSYKAGRGDGGKISVRHRGGRVKRNIVSSISNVERQTSLRL